MAEVEKIIAEARALVKDRFAKAQEHCLTYHNWNHTVIVHDAVVEIAARSEVSEAERQSLQIAALFHDVAYVDKSKTHEEDSAKIAESFLQERAYATEQIALVRRLILATKMGVEPTDKLEGIMKDADASHLSMPDYLVRHYEDLYLELKKHCMPDMSRAEWAKKTEVFLTEHQYYSDYAQRHYGPEKERNMEKLKELIEKDNWKEDDDAAVQAAEDGAGMDEPTSPGAIDADKPKKKKDKGKKSDIPEKGIETMFRVSLRNHMNLSRIADNKANTLMSVNAIIISIVLSALFPKLDNNPYLIYPGISLITFSIITIIMSVLSTVPKTTHGQMSRSEVMEKKGNLIFFGNFHSMSLNDYEWGIDQLMGDKEYLYKSLTRDLYYLGKVLNRKYTLLRYSYYIFVSGLIVTISLFIMSVWSLIQ